MNRKFIALTVLFAGYLFLLSGLAQGQAPPVPGNDKNVPAVTYTDSVPDKSFAKEQDLTLENGKIKAVFSQRGAGLSKLVLLQEKPVVLIDASQGGALPLSVGGNLSLGPESTPLAFDTADTGWNFIREKNNHLTFWITLAKDDVSFSLRKDFWLDEANKDPQRAIQMQLTVQKIGKTDFHLEHFTRGVSNFMPEDKTAPELLGASGVASEIVVKRFSLSSLLSAYVQDEIQQKRRTAWVGIRKDQQAALLAPAVFDAKDDNVRDLKIELVKNLPVTELVSYSLPYTAKQFFSKHLYRLYAGPIDEKSLGAYVQEHGFHAASPSVKSAVVEADPATLGITVIDPPALDTKVPEEMLTLENKFLRVKFTRRGAGISELTFPSYPKNPFPKKSSTDKVLLTKTFETYNANNQMEPVPPTLAITKVVLKSPSDEETDSDKIDTSKTLFHVSRDNNKLIFTATLAKGTQKLQIQKIFWMEDSDKPELKHSLRMDVKLTNLGTDALQCKTTIRAVSAIIPDDPFNDATITGVNSLGRGDNMQMATRVSLDLKGQEELRGSQTNNMDIGWVGVHEKYFAIILAPEDPKQQIIQGTRLAGLHLANQPTEWQDNIIAEAQCRAVDLAPQPQMGQGEAPFSNTESFRLYAGPYDWKITAPYDGMHNFSKTNYLGSGWFGFVDYGLLWLLKACHTVTGNYGIAILLLTLIMQVVLHPLTRKQYVSMNKMQKLQPEINKIKEKYKNTKDQQKMSMEISQLFKKHNASPTAGCWPLLLQLPVFISLFAVLRYSFELRQAPFFMWITDLSLPDAVCELNLNFWFISVKTLNILPILMTIAWVIQMKMQPKSEDPQQAQQQKMMFYMTIFFGFLLYSFASGLCLYWLFRNILTVFEQAWIKKDIKKHEMQQAAQTANAAH